MMKKNLFVAALLLLALVSCKEDEVVLGDPVYPYSITVKVDEVHQQMIGFGGALTWYCDRVTSSPFKEEITDLFFNDLGADILRLKNWYYPVDYPTNKSTDLMEPGWFTNHFDATNELYDIAKTKNPSIKVLLSSWSPPVALKSNGMLNTGMLKQHPDGNFMYEEFAEYWEDILDHIDFNPDYLSIQNEPSYENEGWETCAWRPTEFGDFGGYDQAFDAVYQKIKDRTDPPLMIGPESANISVGFDGKSFHEFSDAIKNRDHLGMYAYHPYNFGSSTTPQQTVSLLERIGQDYGDRPNIMTEYSGHMDWFKTARFINNTLVYANTSAYIYWELMWAESESAMIYVSNNGNYEITPYYYLIKHYAKNIDEGYKRLGTEASKDYFESSAFISPDGNSVTVIAMNTGEEDIDVEIRVPDMDFFKMDVWQSVDGAPVEELYKANTDLEVNERISLPSGSISTIVFRN